MSNIPQNSMQKPADKNYSNQSNQGTTTPSQKGQEHSTPSGQDKNADHHLNQQNGGNKSAVANKTGDMKNDTKSGDPRRDREEEDRPRSA